MYLSSFPSFPISQKGAGPSGLVSFGKLGNWEVCTCTHFPISQFPKWCWAIWAGVFWEIWEIGKYVPVLISQFPNFPNGAGPSGLVSFGKLGNWEVCTCTHFPISQFPKWCWAIWAGIILEIGKYVPVLISQFPNFPKRCWPIWAGVFWEIGKLGSMYPYSFPNFPISQKVLGHLGWCLLGNLEIGKYVPVLISQFPNFPNVAGPSGLVSFGKFGKLGSMYLYSFPNFPISQMVLGHLGWCLLGKWEIGKLGSMYLYSFPNFPISQMVLGHLGWCLLEIGKLGNRLGEICL